MNIILRENLKTNPDSKNVYQILVTVNGQTIDVSLDPDDVEIEKTIDLVNKIIGNFEFYEGNARKIITKEYLKNYNDNWRDQDKTELDEKAFSENLTVTGMSFLSDTSIDIFYSENGMFHNHSLIAQSFDGENFEGATMYG